MKLFGYPFGKQLSANQFVTHLTIEEKKLIRKEVKKIVLKSLN